MLLSPPGSECWGSRADEVPTVTTIPLLYVCVNVINFFLIFQVLGFQFALLIKKIGYIITLTVDVKNPVCELIFLP